MDRLGLGAGHPWMIAAHRLRRRLRKVDDRLCRDYLANARVRKLHIGGGPRRLDGWLNTDIALLPGIFQMDATLPFPFADATFDYIFTEHMIEHLPFASGLNMLRECNRVLRRGGVIRVTTPDLAKTLGLYGSESSQAQQDYLTWFCGTFVPERPISPVHAINAMFRLWGHQFLYDESTLASALHQTVFCDIRKMALMQSDHSELRNLENIDRYPAGLLDFESISLEARK